MKPNKKIDTTLSTALFHLPGSVVSNPDAKTTHRRSPSATCSATSPSRSPPASGSRAMKMDVLSKADLADLKPHGLDDRTPLRFYILREAAVIENGERLGGIGARIVAEVFIGLIQGDRSSYRSQDPDWKSFLPTVDASKTGEHFSMVDLLRLAGVG